MRIGDVARRAGVSTKAVRRYEALGLLAPPRLANGYRTFTEHDVRVVRELRTLRDLGIPAGRTRPFLDCLASGAPEPDDCPSSMAEYRTAIAELDTRIAELASRRAALKSRLTAAAYRTSCAPPPAAPTAGPRPPGQAAAPAAAVPVPPAAGPVRGRRGRPGAASAERGGRAGVPEASEPAGPGAGAAASAGPAAGPVRGRPGAGPAGPGGRVAAGASATPPRGRARAGAAGSASGLGRVLRGRALPRLVLGATGGGGVDLQALGPGRTVLYVYPLTGRPDVDLPAGWDGIPGARGCTAEACGFRDHHRALADAGASAVYGVSSQDTGYQREVVRRLRLPFEMLSDPRRELAAALGLPMFEAGGELLYTRLTMIVSGGVVEKLFHPVTAPGEHAGQVLRWLEAAR